MDDRPVGLRDGRTLMAREWGDPDGKAVLFFAGTPDSRLIGPLDPELPARMGVRLFTFDRPGYGGSSPSPGRTLQHWVEDLSEALDQLTIGHFAVTAWSGGSPYALATAEAMRERVERVALVSPVAPVDGMAGPEQFPKHIAREVRAARLPLPRNALAKVVAKALEKPLADRTADVSATIATAYAESRADTDLLAQLPELRSLLETNLLEALRQGQQGWADDAVTLMRGWGVHLGEIRARVSIWHGTADASVNINASRVLDDALPRSTLRELNGQGHLVLFRLWEEVLA